MMDMPERRDETAGQIDWAEIHRKMNALKTTLESRWSPDADETRRILSERARVLARPVQAAESPADELVYLQFTMADEAYGIETAFITDVSAIAPPTPVPGTPAFVAGLITLRGQILSVIDLAAFFGVAASTARRWNKVIVLSDGDMTVGILAQEIAGVRRLARETLQTAAPGLMDSQKDYVAGIAQAKRVVILDAAMLLASRDILVDDDTVPPGASALEGVAMSKKRGTSS